MLKKLTAAVLTTALLLCCLCVGAAAKPFEEDWSDLSFTMRDLPSGETVSYRADGGIPTVLLFGGIGSCYNTNTFIGNLISLEKRLEPGSLQAFIFDVRGVSKERVDYVFSEVVIPQGFYVGVQESIAPASPLRRILELLNGPGSLGYTMPAVAYIDAEGTVMEITTGDVSRQSIVTRLAKIGVTQKVKDSAEVLLRGEYRQTEARRELDRINELRANEAWYWNQDNETKTELTDLQPLVYDYALEKVAMQRAAELAMYYDHTRPDGTIFYEAHEELGYGYSSVGENIAYGFTSAADVQIAWEEEYDLYDGQGHRRNMLNGSFRAFGSACFEYKGTRYWVQEFSGGVVSPEPVPAKDGEAACSVRIPSNAIAEWWTEPETLELKKGETAQINDRVSLFAGLTNGGEFEMADRPAWRSTNEKTLRVKADGTVTALAEGTAAITAALPTRTGEWTVAVTVTVTGEVPFAAEKAAFTVRKTEAEGTADAQAEEGDSKACRALIEAAKSDIDALSYDDGKTLQQNEAAVDALLAKLKKDLAGTRSAENRTAFDAYKADAIKAVDAMAYPDDGEIGRELMQNAKTAIGVLTCDDSKTAAENKAAVDAVIAKLKNDLAADRALRKAFSDYCVEAKKTASAMAREGDGEACAEMIENARIRIGGMIYDESKTLEENEAFVDNILSQLEERLAAKREERIAFDAFRADAKKTADAMAQAGDGEDCKALIDGAKNAIDALVYDEKETRNKNEKAVNAILAKLEKDLAAVRAAARRPGDVDGDGTVTPADARLALRCSVGLENYGEGSEERLACDVDGDKTVTPGDARLILRGAVGLEDVTKWGAK